MANGIFDAAIALRLLYLLTIDIKTLPGYKLGLFGENGEILKKPTTKEEKAATSMLLRLVMRIRSFLSNIPLAQSKFGKFASAYALVKECVDRDLFLPSEAELETIFEAIELDSTTDGQINELVVQLFEDGIANVSGAAVATDTPAKMMKVGKRPKAEFSVSNDTFKKFGKGKTKFKRWGHYLNLEDENEQRIYHYAKKNPRGILVLKDEVGNAKGIRYSKHGGGNWHGIKRKPRQVVESYIEQDLFDLDCIDLC